MRDSARVGDSIYVTGTVGDAAAGLRILQGELRARGAARKFLVDRSGSELGDRFDLSGVEAGL